MRNLTIGMIAILVIGGVQFFILTESEAQSSSCNSGYTLFNGSCFATQQACNSLYAKSGVQTFLKGSYSACQAVSCNSGYNLQRGGCVSAGNFFPAPPAATYATWDATAQSLLDPVVFNWEFYLDWNPDLRPAGIKTQAAAQQHWTSHGYSECRRASAEFSSLDYLKLNPDVAAANGSSNCVGALSHYLGMGRNENRQKTYPFSYGVNLGGGSATFGNQKITLRSSASYAGTVTELWFRGTQFINNPEAGRMFATDLTLDGYGECDKPSEAGSLNQKVSSSQLLTLTTGNGNLTTVVNPAYWYPPGQQAYCGTAQGSGPVSNTLIAKNVTVGVNGDDQIILWQSTVNLPANHNSMTIESLAGNLDSSFTSYYSFDPYTFQLDPTSVTATAGYQPQAVFAYPVVVATADGSRAIGVFPIDQENQTPDNLLRMPESIRFTYLTDPNPAQNTTKFSVQFNYPTNVAAGNYTANIYLVVGNLEEVRTRMANLQDTYRHQTFSLLASAYGPQAYTSSYYESLYSDLAAAFGKNFEQLVIHLFYNGMLEGRSASPELNVLAYLNRYHDLQQAYGKTNLIAALKHFIETGIAEGRDGALANPVPAISLPLAASVNDPTPKIFTKYVYSFPLPAGATSAVGLSGTVSISGYAGNGLLEALFDVYDLPSGNCPASGSTFTDYGTLFSQVPGATLITSSIVKAFNNQTQSASVTAQFPNPLPISGCVFIILDGGQLNAGGISMTSSMNLLYTAQTSASAYIDGSGSENLFGLDLGPGSTSKFTGTFATVVSVPVSGRIVKLFGDISQGAISSPAGPWSVTNQYYLDPGCTQFGAPGIYGPGPYSPSSKATMLMSSTFSGTAADVDLLQTINQPVNVQANAGDCVVTLVTGNVAGGVDSESQVHFLIQP